MSLTLTCLYGYYYNAVAVLSLIGSGAHVSRTPTRKIKGTNVHTSNQ